ncbi:MAG: LinF [Candidatus Adiutrix sp.]|nr:LinF [Candidatus Adiutrix sp.]
MMDFPQPVMIERVRELALADERISAALMYGSFIRGEGDQFSDIEFYLFYRSDPDHREWVAGVRPLRMFFRNEFGTEVAIFDNLVRGEFHFGPVEDIEVVKSWEGETSFEHADQMILADKDGRLAEVLSRVSRERPRHDSPEQIRWLGESLLNNLLLLKNLAARGEGAHAQQTFQFLQKYLIQLIRLADAADNHWENSAKMLEKEISAAWYAAYAACVPDLAPGRMAERLKAAVALSRKLFVELNMADDLRALLEDIAAFTPE